MVVSPDWRKHVETKPDVCHGKPVIVGTRIMVSVVLDNLAAGMPAEEIVKEYPPLKAEDVQAALAYAAYLAHEEEIVTLRG
jgi:uncharacterized protein (DUF433 family)